MLYFIPHTVHCTLDTRHGRGRENKQNKDSKFLIRDTMYMDANYFYNLYLLVVRVACIIISIIASYLEVVHSFPRDRGEKSACIHELGSGN